jgi:hypothetical protein
MRAWGYSGTWRAGGSAVFICHRPRPRSSFSGSVGSRPGAGLELALVVSSSMPSAILEQDAQMFGLRERAFPVLGIGSPQHLQIREFMGTCEGSSQCLDRLAANYPDGVGLGDSTFLSSDTATKDS